MEPNAAEWVDIEDLVPWTENPRDNDHAVDEVAKSLERFGWGAVIIARRENGRVIAGHTRLKAAIKLGHEKVPVRFVDITEHESRALALADNRLGELANWSQDLSKILSELDKDEVNLDGLGWSLVELEKLMVENEPAAQFEEFNEDIGTDHRCPKCNYEWSGASS